MKKMIAFVLAAVLILSLCACGTAAKKTEEPKAEETTATVTGGWTVQDSTAAALPEEDQKVFDEAAAQWNGGELKAVALLGTQVVAGTNYCYLAQSVSGYELVYIYQDLQNNVTLSKVVSIDLTAETYGASDTEQLAGGWTVAEETYAAPSEDDKAVLDKAQEALTGAGYQLVATLGTQVVSGTNYLMLCKETMVTANPVTILSVVKVYQSLDGTTQITDVLPLSIGDMSEAE